MTLRDLDDLLTIRRAVAGILGGSSSNSNSSLPLAIIPIICRCGDPWHWAGDSGCHNCTIATDFITTE